MAGALDIAESEIARYCRRWKITELLVFESAVRDELPPDSDFDLLVSFSPEADWSLLDERSSNRIRRQAILSSARPYYVAQRSGE